MSRSKTNTATRTTRSTEQVASSSTSTGTPPRTQETPRHSTRKIKNYSFEYQRDRVSRRAGSSFFRVESKFDDEGLYMTLQEAQSLYNFLGQMLNNNQ